MAINQTSRLLALPTELRLVILAHLDFDSLSRVYRVCREFYTLTVPELYRSVLLSNEESGRLFAANYDRQLEQYVNRLTIHAHGVHRFEKPLCVDDLVPKIARLGELKTLTVKECTTSGYCTKACCRGKSGKVVAPMARTSRLQEIFLKSIQSPVLGSLRTCELRLSRHDYDKWDLSNLDAIFLHPQLRTLSIFGATISTFPNLIEDRKHSTNLDALTLINCYIDILPFSQLLSLPKSLSQFIYKGIMDDSPLYLDALRQQAPSLTTLDLNLDFWDLTLPDETLDLQAFPSLENLSITFSELQGRNKDITSVQTENPFPRTLNRLSLYDPCRFYPQKTRSLYIEAISRWVKSGQLGKLASLSIIATNKDPRDKVQEEVGNVFRDTGVVFQRRDEPRRGCFPLECDCCQYDLDL